MAAVEVRADPVEAIRQSQRNLAESAARAGLRADPLADVLSGLSETLEALAGLYASLTGMLTGPRPPLSERDLTELSAMAGQMVTKQLVAQERRARRRATTLLAVLALGCVVFTGAACYWAGSAPGRMTERRLQAAFADGTGAAALWATLMENNDLPAALQQCTGSRSFADASGRRVCLVPLYVEAPRRAPAAR